MFISDGVLYMDDEKTEWCISIMYADPKGVVVLGGAGWATREEQDREWKKIPEAPLSSPGTLFADKLSRDGDRLEERAISVATVEALLGKPVQDLITAGRESLCPVRPNFYH